MLSVLISLFQTARLSMHSRAALQLEILALRHQLHVLERCGSRNPGQAAVGSWTRSLQWETQRTWFRLAGAIVCPPAKVSGVWPSNEA